MEPFAVQILRGCGIGLSSKNKDEGDIPDKTEREDE